MKKLYKFIPPLLAILALIGLEVFSNIELKSADYINISLVILTYFYVALTWEMVKNIKDESHLEKRPYIIFDVKPQNSFLYFQVENIGKTLAKNLKVSIDPDIKIIKNYTLNTSIFKSAIPYFPPKKQVQTYIGSKSDFFEENPISFQVTISYSDNFENNYKESYNLDLTHIKKELYPIKKDINDLVKTIDKLVSAVKELNQK